VAETKRTALELKRELRTIWKLGEDIHPNKLKITHPLLHEEIKDKIQLKRWKGWAVVFKLINLKPGAVTVRHAHNINAIREEEKKPGELEQILKERWNAGGDIHWQALEQQSPSVFEEIEKRLSNVWGDWIALYRAIGVKPGAVRKRHAYPPEKIKEALKKIWDAGEDIFPSPLHKNHSSLCRTIYNKFRDKVWVGWTALYEAIELTEKQVSDRHAQFSKEKALKPIVKALKEAWENLEDLAPKSLAKTHCGLYQKINRQNLLKDWSTLYKLVGLNLDEVAERQALYKLIRENLQPLRKDLVRAGITPYKYPLEKALAALKDYLLVVHTKLKTTHARSLIPPEKPVEELIFNRDEAPARAAAGGTIQ